MCDTADLIMCVPAPEELFDLGVGGRVRLPGRSLQVSVDDLRLE
jgi:hypothetical protein